MSTPFTVFKQKYESLGHSLDTTKRALGYGARDSERGWRTLTYTTTANVEVVINRQVANITNYFPGFHSRYIAKGYTATSFNEGDQILDAGGVYWEVTAVQLHERGATDQYYELDLVESPMWQAVPGTYTSSKTRPRDERYRIKNYIDTKARAAQITKDDDSTQALFAAIWANPPYPLRREFRAASTPVFGLYCIEKANSTPTMNYDNSAYGYVEHVPVHICAVNSTGCSGDFLAHKMLSELRYVCESYPTGSHFGLEFRRNNSRQMGDMWLFDHVFMLEYWRLKTT